MAELQVADFLKHSQTLPVIDVRSPGEYENGHIPGAFNIPIFDNDERAQIGTCYKQVGRNEAIKLGLKLVGPKMHDFVVQSEKLAQGKEVLVHCWRGGMRSGSFAWLLNTSGLKAHTLSKGYKAYRNFFHEKVGEIQKLVLIGGETGSGKTEILKALEEKGEQIIDLEKLAKHKGSSFGNLSGNLQPTTEQFQNDLLKHILSLDLNKRIWIEDESHHIGSIRVPDDFWLKMRSSPVIRILKDKSQRIDQLVKDYGGLPFDLLEEGVLRIEKKIGGLNCQLAKESLMKGDLNKVAELCLNYYDKAYNSGLRNRAQHLIYNLEIGQEMCMDEVVGEILSIHYEQ